ncbi:MAG TPA: hypothetical protein VG057_01890 [Solirubrobacteraceae bacterium]|jgi:hypothetical protein|nr:hypothetical protein [Solirubrobacteraceae bacterium]
MSLSAPATSDGHLMPLAYLDVVILVVAAPIMLLIGVPAVGYLVGAGAWIVLRAVGVAIERVIPSLRDPRGEVTLRLAYLLGRLFTLAIAVILVRNGAGRDDGLTALIVVVFAFTTQLVLSFLTRPSRPRSR